MKCSIRKTWGAVPALQAMNFLERIPTRWLLAGAALACLALWAAPSVAQTADPLLGQALYDDTPNVDGVPNTIINSCSNCHSAVQNRRTQIGGSAFADISLETAQSRLGNAIATRSAMSQFQALSFEQVEHIAAYIADTPKVTATGLDALNALPFVSSAVGVALTRNITINHSIATTDNLQITNVSLGAGTTAFTRTGACNGVTRAPAGTCTFSVTYTPTSTTAETKTLTITLQQGTVSFNRAITLNGSVAGAPPAPPPPATGGGDDDGGGALGWAWLSGLALATAVLARRRRA